MEFNYIEVCFWGLVIFLVLYRLKNPKPDTSPKWEELNKKVKEIKLEKPC
jgi:hypothetical protein